MKKTLTSFLLCLFISSPSSAEVYTRAFGAKKESVWKGVLIALSKYPLDKNSQESGEITTSKIPDGEIFRPHNHQVNHNLEYQLFINLENRRYKGRKITLVKIEKKSILKGDFIKKEKEVESDGVEEQVLLYRMAREIKIDRKVEKLFAQ